MPNAKFDPNRDIHLSTLTLYARAIDTKDFPLFFTVITSNAFAGYTGYLSNLTGLPTITSELESAVANIDIRHLSGIIETDTVEQRDVVTADSTTYSRQTYLERRSWRGRCCISMGIQLIV